MAASMNDLLTSKSGKMPSSPRCGPASRGRCLLPRDADQQVREDAFFPEMRISKSGKMSSSPRCGSASPGECLLPRDADQQVREDGLSRKILIPLEPSVLVDGSLDP